ACLVRHGERVAVQAISQAKLALEIHAPQLVRSLGCDALARGRRPSTSTATSAIDKTRILEQHTDGALRRPADIRLFPLELRSELLRPPGGIPMPHLKQLLDDRLRSALRATNGPT